MCVAVLKPCSSLVHALALVVSMSLPLQPWTRPVAPRKPLHHLDLPTDEISSRAMPCTVDLRAQNENDGYIVCQRSMAVCGGEPLWPHSLIGRRSAR